MSVLFPPFHPDEDYYLDLDLKKILTYDKMIVVEGKENHAKKIAKCIAEEIQLRQRFDQHLVLGLATSSTPIPLYDELVRLHVEEGLSFRDVFTFNLDEYCGLYKIIILNPITTL